MPRVVPELTRRELNRATLARQLLLDRAEMDGVAAVACLGGLQAQMPQSFHIGLFSRLAEFDPHALGAAVQSRAVVRLPVMRGTIHLVTAEDALGMRPLLQDLFDAALTSQFGKRLVGVDRAKLVARARELTEQQPRTASELGRALRELFPESDVEALGQAARAWLPMVQAPPRGVWRRAGLPRQVPMDTWLGRSPQAYPREEMVMRYLRAFGPASVRDVQTWCGLTRLGEVVAALGDRLMQFTGEDGVRLYDVPDGPRPSGDMPAPVRYLYEFDSLLLSHADRRRVLEDPAAWIEHGKAANRLLSALLVDGFVAGAWIIDRSGDAVNLTVRGLRRFSADERSEISAEGRWLLEFLHPESPGDVRFLDAR